VYIYQNASPILSFNITLSLVNISCSLVSSCTALILSHVAKSLAIWRAAGTGILIVSCDLDTRGSINASIIKTTRISYNSAHNIT
jgi:hypothetical protein